MPELPEKKVTTAYYRGLNNSRVPFNRSFKGVYKAFIVGLYSRGLENYLYYFGGSLLTL